MAQFLKFAIIGVSNTLISMIVYYIFILIDSDFYLVGNVAAFFISVGNSFYWNNKYVFCQNSKSDIFAKIFKTYLSYGFSFILGLILVLIEVELLGLSAFVVPIINMVITVPINFLLNKFWAFK